MTLTLKNQHIYIKPINDRIKVVPIKYEEKFTLPPQTDDGLS